MKKIAVVCVAVFVAVSAMADYDWWNTVITIAGSDYDVTGWSTDSANGTDLGAIDLAGSVFQISAASANVWSDSGDRGGLNMYFNTFVGGTQDAAGQDWHVGGFSTSDNHNYAVANSTGVTVGSVTLEVGDVVGIDLWAKTYGTSGDEWLNAGGDNYHAYFTVVPEPATVGMLGLGALLTLLVRRMTTS